MVAQSPPFAEQNAQHSAALFRLATFSPWRTASGVVGPSDFAVTAQPTPNMSVQVGAGRAWLKGTQVASVSGGNWSTQGAYYGYNDAPVTLTVAAADPTNPRVDAVVAYATDSFYSGSTNTFVLGIVTGTPAASPQTPAVPSNGLLLATVAVAANATSIASGNIAAATGLTLTARGGVQPVSATDVVPGEGVGQYRDHPTLGLQRWNGTVWKKMPGLPTLLASAPTLAQQTNLVPGMSGFPLSANLTVPAHAAGTLLIVCNAELTQSSVGATIAGYVQLAIGPNPTGQGPIGDRDRFHNGGQAVVSVRPQGYSDSDGTAKYVSLIGWSDAASSANVVLFTASVQVWLL